MFKLRITFVTLALLSSVLSRPVPAPSQQLVSSGDVNTLGIPGLSAVTGLLRTAGIGGGDNNDESDNSDDDNSDDDNGGLLKRQIGGGAAIFAGPDLFDTLLKRQDGNGSDEDATVEDASTDDNQNGSDQDVRDFVGRAKRQDDSGDDSDDNGDDNGGDDAGDDSGDDNSRREDADLPFFGASDRYHGGLRGPHEHTGLAGLGDNVGDALTSLGKGLGQLLKRQDDGGDDSDDTTDNSGDDSGDDNSRREESLGIPFLGGNNGRYHHRYRGGLRGPHEHTGLAGLGDNLGDALTSLGKGLGQLLKRQEDPEDGSEDNNGADIGDDSGDDSGEDNERREESASRRPVLRRPRLPIPGYDGLIGPHEHTGLAGLGDNLGDALTSLGAGLGQLL